MNNIKMKDNYYSTREAAKRLGVAVSTIQLWTDNGILKAWITAGGHRRIFANSVNDLYKQQNSTSEIDSNIAPHTKNDIKNTSTMSIVIVEDNKSLQRLYKQQLTALGLDLSINVASDGFEGLIRIGELCPDIIITDLMMPNIDGFQLIKALVNFNGLKNSLIVAVSAMTKQEIEYKGGLPNNVELIAKPFLIEDMHRVVYKKINKLNKH